MLAAFASEHGEDWDLRIDSVFFHSKRCSSYESTGHSSYDLISRRTPRMPIEIERIHTFFSNYNTKYKKNRQG